jgi:hypothetical protein
MLEFFAVIAFIGICSILFGKADNKRSWLNVVGLDLRKDTYVNIKKDEFRKYTLKAMKAVVDLESYDAKDESSFLGFMSNNLWQALLRYSSLEQDDSKKLNLGVKENYIKHASRVVSRRLEDLKKGNNKTLSKLVNFSDKKSAKKYCELIWEEYQYPWPEDWLQNDSI